MNHSHKTKLLTGKAYYDWYMSDPVRKKEYMTSDLCALEVNKRVHELNVRNNNRGT
jgi:hypothetical protein